MLEKQTFGSEPSIGLSANLSGTANGDLVSVTKTYDGSGGQTHSVNYVFTLDEEGEILHGIWSLNGMSGRVVFRRVTPQIFSEILN
ncbi:MAG: hypothetical protein CMI09_08860 [Oceanospirillaceae bacterium]|nr:hypothetical protein [Oceanospirillaceae bacterium]|tara:strand:+ start:497 stop:754 length:258 start_codon:yes stop_codon:yes gene_type:complete